MKMSDNRECKRDHNQNSGDENKKMGEPERRIKPNVQRLSGRELLNMKKMDSRLPTRGVKDFAPDNSPWQQQRLDSAYAEQKNLLSEERVTRHGSLAQATWNGGLGLAELTLEKGKFWNTMGHHINDKKWLLPEEALFLMNGGSLELYCNGVPLSIQEAYSILIPEYVPIEYYQVYSHLQRLGYIVIRHQGTQFTSYEIQIRLDQYQVRNKQIQKKIEFWQQASEYNKPVASECRKSKSSLGHKTSSYSPVSFPSFASPVVREEILSSVSECSDGSHDIVQKKHEEIRHSEINLLSYKQNQERMAAMKAKFGNKKHRKPKQHSSEHNSSYRVEARHSAKLNMPSHSSMVKESESTESTDNSFDNVMDEINIDNVLEVFCDLANEQVTHGGKRLISNQAAEYMGNTAVCSNIQFPNIADNCPMNEFLIVKPGLLPQSIEAASKEKHRPNVAQFVKLQHLIQMTAEASRITDSMMNTSHQHCDTLNSILQQEIGDCLRKASNWSEFKELEHQQKKKLNKSKRKSLWPDDSIQPLVMPSDAVNTSNILDKLGIIKNVNVDCNRKRPRLDKSLPIQIAFDVYLPDSGYKKTNPGIPHLKICVVSSSDAWPTLNVISRLLHECQGVPLLWAVLDNADISFHIFHDVNLPRSINGNT
ncbi:tRNA-splicing endonuclease subunit Sen54-like [Saccoglossus kowalevskii]|uniref:tRNA-splicing endonuclease subunit Sen54-like n=1 Tax=Saccoglossus kowalevskii TaxID=10224 RepID=A0ABM0GX71_SACKO|nr:PREDICTED: tRNA-splicing endonuclease subunit Sen54-like [Saccoglossus kowalevskii]